VGKQQTVKIIKSNSHKIPLFYCTYVCTWHAHTWNLCSYVHTYVCVLFPIPYVQ